MSMCVGEATGCGERQEVTRRKHLAIIDDSVRLVSLASSKGLATSRDSGPTRDCILTATNPYAGTTLANPDAAVIDEYGISKRDITQIYFSSHPYHEAFKEELNLQRFH